MTTSSCLYTGTVLHHRLRPRAHRLRYRVFWMLIDLEEIDALSSRLRFFSHNRFNLASFQDRDHGDGSVTSLRKQAEELLRNAGCQPDGGRITLLCMPRVLGYGFNPLSVYFCHRMDGSLNAIIYEVHNTFGERHCYVIGCDGAEGGIITQHCDKDFYVSPFLGMDISYTFSVQQPREHVKIAIVGKEGPEPVITAVLSGARKELTNASLLKAWISHPLLTLKVIGAIHWHALKMVLKGFHIHRHAPRPAHAVRVVRERGH